MRRLHDLGQRGWLALGMAIPGFNLFLGGALAIVPGQADANRYGPPKRNGVFTWLAYILFVLIPVGLTPAALLQYDLYSQERAATRTA